MHLHVCKTCNAELDQCDLDAAAFYGVHRDSITELRTALAQERERAEKAEMVAAGAEGTAEKLRAKLEKTETDARFWNEEWIREHEKFHKAVDRAEKAEADTAMYRSLAMDTETHASEALARLSRGTLRGA